MGRMWATVDRVLREGFSDEDSPLYQRVNSFLVILILISVVSVVLASVQPLYEEYQLLFDLSEVVVVTIFTAEYLINIYVAKNRWGYVLGVWGIIDLLAILPSILLMFDIRALKVARVLRVLRFLRLMRILRVLKLAKVAARQYEKRKTAGLNTVKLDLQIYFIALLSALVISSTLVFYAEETVPSTLFTSIPASMWWGIVTITTTGYGDMAPVTIAGRVVAGLTMLTGLALFGLLMNVVGKAMLASLFGAADLEGHGGGEGKGLAAQLRTTAGAAVPGHDAVVAGGHPAGGGTLVCARGHSLSEEWRFCPACGVPVGDQGPEGPR
jgi:voltage-gated potassium channel